ncbi:DHHA1 domain-containing protein [Nanoarchaeota archaeon]
MTNYEKFRQHIVGAVKEFNKIPKNEKIRVISHLDSDGINACAIAINALSLENRPYSISIIEQLDEKIIEKLSKEDYNVYLFSDIGSGQLSMINKHLGNKKIIILDHHTPDGSEIKENTIYVNPHLHDIDGGMEIAGSGVVYLFAKELNQKNKKLAHLAVIGAIGDVQDKNGFEKLNSEILNEAVEQGLIEVKKGINLYGSQTRPIHKALEYSELLDMNESEAIQFLNSIGINSRTEKDWKKMPDLTGEEIKTLAAGIIMKRKGQEDSEDIFTDQYLITGEEDGTQFRDAKEFSTLLNSCGRLNKASIGIGACLGDKKARKKALSSSKDYKRQLAGALNWFRENPDIIKGDNYIIINAKDNILHTIAGTLASIISKSGDYPDNMFIMCLARNRNQDNFSKVSIRMTGKPEIDISEVAREIVAISGGEAGGHKSAAGAIIEAENDEKFIEAAKEVFSKY